MTENMSFEQAMVRLQQVVKQIEKGDISLDESVNLFKEGSDLSAFCYNQLNSAKQEIIKINQETSMTIGD
ncbi:MAG: exodeoxyribonuclease VII small subunit [Clostridia bacterium]